MPLSGWPALSPLLTMVTRLNAAPFADVKGNQKQKKIIPTSKSNAKTSISIMILTKPFRLNIVLLWFVNCTKILRMISGFNYSQRNRDGCFECGTSDRAGNVVAAPRCAVPLACLFYAFVSSATVWLCATRIKRGKKMLSVGPLARITFNRTLCFKNV